MEFYLKTRLPVVWAIVATVIALTLYRTSAALFDGTRRSSTETKRLRLAGSVVIAALAFLGMKLATPSANLKEISEGTVLVRGELIGDVRDAVEDLSAATDALEGCHLIAAAGQCSAELQQIKDRAGRVRSTTERLLPRREEASR